MKSLYRFGKLYFLDYMIHVWLIFKIESSKIETYKIKTIQNALIFPCKKIHCRKSHCLCFLIFDLYKVNFSIPNSSRYPTNIPSVFHVETTCIRPFPRRFNVEYAWCVCRAHVRGVARTPANI